MASRFMQRLQWLAAVPPPVNKRKQSLGWECGLYCLQFLEEALREARSELVPKNPVHLQSIIERVNVWISKVQPFLQDRTSVSAAAVLPESSASKSEALAAADSAVDAPVGSSLRGPVLQHALAPVCGDELSEKVTVPSHVGDLTIEQALSARQLCNKGCHGSGCSFCMGQWFVPKVVLLAVRSASAGAAVEGDTVVSPEPVA